jgi:DNA-binding CsgD family transcriptional regulator
MFAITFALPISNQQSAISNQQSAISNQKSMSLWQRFLHWLGFRRPEAPLPVETRTFHLENDLARSLQELAIQEQRPSEEIAAEMIANAFAQRQTYQEILRCWWTLSPREQQVTALICQNYTNPQIATHLVLSKETIRTHVRNVLRKFGLRSRAELRYVLVEQAGWEFREAQE